MSAAARATPKALMSTTPSDASPLPQPLLLPHSSPTSIAVRPLVVGSRPFKQQYFLFVRMFKALPCCAMQLILAAAAEVAGFGLLCYSATVTRQQQRCAVRVMKSVAPTTAILPAYKTS
jgi:hypothetical protein